MKEENLLNRITVNPEVMVGKPTIRGLRITVEQIYDYQIEISGGCRSRQESRM